MDSGSSVLNNSVKVAVLAGGIGSERDVSIESGKNVTHALKQGGVNVVPFDITPDDMSILDDKSIDVFFLALHGRFGEDGQLQQILEDKELAYTGCGPKASAIAFDKLASKKVFENCGIDVPKSLELNNETDLNKFAEQLTALSKKYVIKPPAQGSSVGVSIAEDTETALKMSKNCLAQFGQCMVEEFIAGTEVTVGVLYDRTLPVIEIRTNAGFYDYNAKYVDETTQFLFDTIEDAEIIDKLSKNAKACFDALDCRDMSRVDFIVSDNNCYCLEVNTIPGFTSHSLLPLAAKKSGISMSDLCIMIVQQALKRRNNK